MPHWAASCVNFSVIRNTIYVCVPTNMNCHFSIKVSTMGKYSLHLNHVISTSEANRVLSQNSFVSDVTNAKSTASHLACVIKLSKLHESMRGENPSEVFG